MKQRTMLRAATGLVAASLLVVSACGSSTNGGKSSSQPPADGSSSSVSDTGAAGDDDTSGSTTVTIAAQAWMITKFHMDEMVEKFEAANPGKTAKLVEYPDNQALANFSLQWSQGQTSQDLVITNGASVGAQFLAKKLIVDFNTTDFFEGATAKDKFVPQSLEFNALDGVQFSLPFGLETYNISANKKYFAEAGLLDTNGDIPAPKDWNELYEMAAKMTKRDGNTVTMPGMTIQWGPAAVSTMMSVSQAVRGTMYGDDGVLSFDNPEMREVFEIWKKGADDGTFSIDTFSNKDAGRSNFNAGNVPMVLETAAHVPEAAPTIGAENATVLPMPGSMENGSFGFTAGIIMPTASKNHSLALKFIKDGMMTDAQVRTGLEWGKLPILNDFFDQMDASWKTEMYDLVKRSQPAPMYRDLPKIQDMGKQLLQTYLTGGSDLEAFLSELHKVIDDADKNPL